MAERDLFVESVALAGDFAVKGSGFGGKLKEWLIHCLTCLIFSIPSLYRNIFESILCNTVFVWRSC